MLLAYISLGDRKATDILVKEKEKLLVYISLGDSEPIDIENDARSK